MTFLRYRMRLLLGLLAALALVAVGVASAAPGGSPRTGGAVAQAEPPLTCHLEGSRVEFTRGSDARAIAVAKAHCKNDRPAKLGIEVTLKEYDGTKVGPKVRELCPNDDTCVAKTSAPRTQDESYCVHAILFYSEPSGGEIKSATSDRCDEPARPPTGGAPFRPRVGGGGG